MFASIVGIALIYLFMLGFYRLPGLVAIIALTTYIYLTLVAFNFISGVLTLPGLAALVLGVGMAVDANIIMYERIKDELRIGRTLKQAYSKANKSSFLTIFDSNLTTVIAAAVLSSWRKFSQRLRNHVTLRYFNDICNRSILIKRVVIITGIFKLL